MKVLFCGSRNWDDVAPILWFLYGMTYSDKNLVLIEGEAAGADSIARECAHHLNESLPDLSIEVRKYPANWDKYGRAAGPIRNREQFDKEQPDVVVGFSSDIHSSRGTRDMLNYAASQGASVYLVQNWPGEK